MPARGQSKKKKTPPRVFFFLLRPRGKAREGEAPLGAGTGPEQKKKNTLSPGPEQKKNTLGGVFFCCGPARTLTHSLRAWVAMPPPRRGGVCFFCCGAEPDRGGVFFFLLWPRPDAHSLTVGWGDFGKARVVFFFLQPRRVFLDNNKKCLGYYIGSKKTRRGHSKKKKHHWVVFFFLLWPRAGAQRGFSFPCLSPGPEQKKTPGWCFFFCSGPAERSRRPTGLLLPLPFAGAGAKKKHPGWCFFCSGPVPARGFSFPCLSPGPEQKKNTLGGVFFFLLRPRADAHSLTAGLGGDASPSPGWCLFFLLRGGAGPGWCFFFFALAPPGRSLTHCGLGRFRQGPGGVFFFLLRPRRVFLDNNKKCLGYYIGSKKTRRGHSKKKKHHFRFWRPP